MRIVRRLCFGFKLEPKNYELCFHYNTCIFWLTFLTWKPHQWTNILLSKFRFFTWNFMGSANFGSLNEKMILLQVFFTRSKFPSTVVTVMLIESGTGDESGWNRRNTFRNFWSNTVHIQILILKFKSTIQLMNIWILTFDLNLIRWWIWFYHNLKNHC